MGMNMMHIQCDKNSHIENKRVDDDKQKKRINPGHEIFFKMGCWQNKPYHRFFSFSQIRKNRTGENGTCKQHDCKKEKCLNRFIQLDFYHINQKTSAQYHHTDQYDDR